jgi:uncharacterized peroxidase-related enzyme
MAYIRTVSPESAQGRLKRLFDQVKGPDGKVDNILTAHSLRPASLEGHMALYKNVLHHNGNQVPKRFLETIGVFVSLLNDCSYCVDHHYAGLRRLVGDDDAAAAIRVGLERAMAEDPAPDGHLSAKECAALVYAKKLTLDPRSIGDGDIESLRAAGWDDGEILEINQVAAYFAYANRTVLGLGVTTDGDELGLSPSGDGWDHR